MKKNPNKAAGNWGALKTKPQNLVPFQVGGKVTVTAGGEKKRVVTKSMIPSKSNSDAMKRGGSVKSKLPKGYHMMSNGKMMKDSAHKKSIKK